jgi:outer membrane lipoprotein-sorting protein
MRRHKLIYLSFLSLLLLQSLIIAQNGKDILEKMDLNRKHNSLEYTSTMTIYVDDEVRSKTMKARAITKGERKAIVEFTNSEDKGTKYLMLGDNLWIYFPDENDVVKISGHMLKEGMMGSDVSYEDALASDELAKKYDVSVLSEEKINGHLCFVIQLDANVKNVPYQKRKMWVDKESYVSLKEEMYAKSGKLLKESSVLDMKMIDGRNIPVKVEITNKLRKNSKTVFEMTDIVYDKVASDEEFSMRYLQR